MARRNRKRQPSKPRDVVEAASRTHAFLNSVGYEGELPTPEQIAKADAGGATLVAECEPGEPQAKRVRVLSTWQPQSMLARGLITARQHDAALRLMADYDAAGFDKIKVQTWGEVVDCGGRATNDVPRMLLAKRQRIGDLLRAMPPLVREVIEAVVLAGRTVETAGASLKAQWLPASAQLRTVSARAFLCIGLEQAADAYGIN